MTAQCVDSTVDLILAEQNHLRRFARRLVRCESDADDLVQETLLRAYDARERFQPGTSMRAWTTVILRRLFLTGAVRSTRRRLRTETDHGASLDEAAAPPSAPHVDPTPDVGALGEEVDDALKSALDRVPEIYRTAFFLWAIRGMTCREVGRHLRVPVGTAMSRIFRARECLKEGLGEGHRGVRRPTASRVGFRPMVARRLGAYGAAT